MKAMKVGELAQRTGVTVRTLHYYEEIHLLTPSHRTAAGHRLYAEADIARLQKIRSLVQLGFSLEEIRGCLDDPEFALAQVIELHINVLDANMERQRLLRNRLSNLAKQLQLSQKAIVSKGLRWDFLDTILDTIKETVMLDKYYTREQRQKLEKRKNQLGQKAIEEGQQAWADLIAEIRTEMDKGTDPSSEIVSHLARRWKNLVKAFTGGDSDIAKSLGKVWQNEHPRLERQHGNHVPSPEMFQYIGEAMKSPGS